LIGKSRRQGLTLKESRDLAHLQILVDQRLEPTDQRLLAAAEPFRKLAEGLPDGTNR
jgi:hypothetical protein